MDDSIIIKNEKTFKTLYSEFYRPLFFYAQKYVKDEIASDDIIQEVFVRLWNQYRNETINSIRSFLYQAVKNECLNYIKKEALKHNYKQQTLKSVSEDDLIYSLYLYEEELFRQINSLIESMPGQRKKIFKMVVKGFDNSTIAELLDVSINTVKTHRLKARQFLKEQLKHVLQIVIGIG